MAFDANGIVFGRTTVSSAGTAVPVKAGATKVKALQIRALPTNTGNMFVGDNTVDSTNGFILQPGESVKVPAGDTNDWYVDAATDDDKICYIGIDY